MSGTAPSHFFSYLPHLQSPSRSLRSSSDTGTFRVTRMGRSFQYSGPVISNSFPLSVRRSPSLSPSLSGDLLQSLLLCQAISFTLFLSVRRSSSLSSSLCQAIFFTLFLSVRRSSSLSSYLSGDLLHSLLGSENWKLISSHLHTDLSFSFFSFYEPVTSNACIFSE